MLHQLLRKRRQMRQMPAQWVSVVVRRRAPCQVLALLDAGAISVSPEGRLPCGASSWHRSVVFSFKESSWVLSSSPVLWLWWLVLMYPEGEKRKG